MSAIVHSHFSLLEGATPIPALLDRAAELGHETVALADTNGLYGAISFYREATARGLRPVLGVDLEAPDGRAVVLARSMRGYSALCRLVSQRHLDPDFRLGPALAGAHRDARDHLAVLTDSAAVLEALAPFGAAADVSVQLAGFDTPEGRRGRARARQLALRYDRPTAAVPPVYFARPDDYPVHRVLTAIRKIKSVAVLLPEETASPHSWLRSPSQIQELYREDGDALARTRDLLDRCRVDLELGKLRFPDFPVPDGHTPASYLRELARAGARERYGTLRPDVTVRLEHELATIEQLGFAPYFLIVWDIVRWAAEHGTPSLGRGSAAGSLVAYALRIANVDPLHHNLCFERFLNPRRTDPPDIDIDLCWRRRQDVLEYVYRRYGDERVAMICTYSTLGARSSLRDVAKAFGVDEEEAGRAAKRLPHGSLAQALEQARPELGAVAFHEEPWRSIVEMGQAIDGFPRHLSTHAGGLVVAPGTLIDLVPVQMSTGGLQITQYDMHGIEALGLLKIDLLGQRSLSVVVDAVRAIEATPPAPEPNPPTPFPTREGGEETAHVDSGDNGCPVPPPRGRGSGGGSLDLSRLPYNDPATLKLINAGQTIGCFQLESPGMRGLLQKMRIRDQETLIAAISVIRPGPADAGMMAHYVARHNGTEPVKHLHPRLESVLAETYGILLYQEDTLRVAQAIAGMDPGEADLLRRAMTKDRSPETMARFRGQFLAGAAREGIDAVIAEEVWKRVSQFAGYAFCKAHSAAYARLSYEAAYLKAHHPAEFMAAVLANGGGFYCTGAYIEECRRMGLRVLPPDVNRSDANFAAEGRGVRVGLGAIKHMTTRTLARLLRERKAGGPYLSYSDLRRRVPLGKAELRSLVRVGALDGFELSRPELLWRLEAEEEPASKAQPEGQFNLFDLDEPSGWGRVVPRVQEYSWREKLLLELELLGFGVQAHPLALFEAQIKRLHAIPAAHLRTRVGRGVRVVGRPVTSKGTITSQGDAMRFVTLDDPTGIFEVTLFPRVYRQYGWVLANGGPYLVEGTVESDQGSISVTAHRLSVVRLDDERTMQLAG